MTEISRRPTEVRVSRASSTEFRATNERGGSITMGTGSDEQFTPVELLLAAIAGCGSIDVDIATARRAEPEVFEVTATGDRVKDADGNRVDNLRVSFRIAFPPGDDGDRARRILNSAIERAHDRLCTVSRTIEAGTPVEMFAEDPSTKE